MRGFLLASVSTAALATTAWAGETPKAMQAMASAPISWTGFYAGLDAGWLQNKATAQELQFGFVDPNASLTINGFTGGAHLGYNWQYQQFVLGAEADFSGVTGSGTTSFIIGLDQFTSRINWLGTIRGRFGVTFDQWLLYGTAGWAEAGVHNTRNSSDGGFILDQTKTKSGFIWGGGVERMFGPNWSARLEAFAVNLGSDTVTTVVPGLGPYITHFTNKAVVARGGVSFKW